VAALRGSLCSRCGSSDWEELSETRVRCAECGLGATRTMLVARRDDAPLDEAVQHEARELQEFMARGMRASFDEATFPCFGLDERWTGRRWYGGQGGSNGRITHLSLAHGDDPYDPSAPQVRVESRAPDEVALRHFLPRDLVGYVWRMTGVLEPEVRHAAFPVDGVVGDATAPWDAVALPVDGRDVEFRVLAAEQTWAALTKIDDVIVSIEAHGWPLERTGLVTITDLAPYDDGTRASWR
jgi:hypothetical protein